MLQLAMPQLHETFPQYQAALLRSHLCLSLPKDLESLVNFTADSLSWDQLLVKLDQMDVSRQRSGAPIIRGGAGPFIQHAYR